MKRFARILLVMALLLCVLPVTVFANGLPPAPYYIFEFSGLPQGTVYVDLLIELPEKDPCYVPLVTENLPEGFSEEAQIVQYCEGNFRSYTFHYAQAASIIRINENKEVYFFTNNPTMDEKRDHLEDIIDRGRIRLAMLDESGNILQVSDTFSIREKHILAYHLNTFHYDGTEDELIIETLTSGLGVIVFAVSSILGLVFTCIVELQIARPFGLLIYHRDLILWTNILSQILMRGLHILLYGWVFNRYVWTVVVLEILVYSGEFLLYRKKMDEEKVSNVLWYTIAANSCSLVLSILPMLMV